MFGLRAAVYVLCGAWLFVVYSVATDEMEQADGLYLWLVLAVAAWLVYCAALLFTRYDTAWRETAAVGVALTFPFIGVGLVLTALALVWGAIRGLRRMGHNRHAHA